jgi:glycosyltransferase involved in cell wall biosynthesis
MAYGGAERQIANLVRSLAQRGHYPIVVGLYEPVGGLLSEIDAIEGVEVVDLKKRHASYLSLVFSVRRLVLSRNIDVAHSLLVGPNILIGLVSLITPIKRVIWGNRVSSFKKGQFGAKGIIAGILSRLLSSRIDVLISNSSVGDAELARRGVQTKQNVIIPNAIDTDRFSPSAQLRSQFRAELGVEDFTILIGQVGRIVDWKGHEIFFHAASEIAKIRKNAQFVIVGDIYSSWGTYLVDLSNKLGLETRVLWVDARDDVECVLNGLDVLTMNSLRGEGFPNIVGEAMSTGTVVVGTDVGATAEILNGNGLIVKPGDVQSLINACLAFIDSPQDRDRVGLLGREFVRSTYSLDVVFRRTEKVLFADGVASLSAKQTMDVDWK